MMLCRKFIKQSPIFSRNISASSSRLLEVQSSKPLSEQRQTEMDESKEKLLWRVKPSEKKGQWYSKFKLFLQDDNEQVKETMMIRLQQPISMKPTDLKKWWHQSREKQERFLQQYIPDRHKILGNDLAAAHFLVYRGGKVKIAESDKWIVQTEEDEVPLPDRYVHGMFIESIDCEGVEIYYEGLENFRRLKSLRFLSFKNVKSFDDWCLDRISGAEFESLEVLNLSGTKVTHRGLQALYRIPTLKTLILDNPFRDTEWKLVIAMLQEILPGLEIVETEPVEAKAVKA